MIPAIVLEDPINPEAGDCFLLCSDGLSGMVSDHEIAKIVGNQIGMSQRDRVNALIEKAVPSRPLRSAHMQSFLAGAPSLSSGTKQQNGALAQLVEQ